MQPGVAGPFVGISGDALIIAGGSNFPDKKPWEGGKKAYVDEVYILEKHHGSAYTWHVTRLPEKLAYGASVTTSGGIVCIGGETPTGHSDKVFLLQWDAASRQLRYKDLPGPPTALANAGATVIDHTIYLAGGENATQALAGFFSLDLLHPTGWQRLADVPVALSHPVAVGVSNAIYLLGGRAKTPSGISTLHNTVFHYDVEKKSWRQMGDVGTGMATAHMPATGTATKPLHLAAANAVADDHGGILLIGGDDGRIFHQLETLNAQIAATTDDIRRKQLQDQKLHLIDHHPGFWRGILRYDPAHDHWTAIGNLPVAAPVTTTAVRWGSRIVLPCGEIKPGTRTADIIMGNLE